MKIKSISCTQFAGVRDKCISFDDGINVIYGKNESGKSTLVNLLSRTLFQNSKLDKRTNKDFFDLYFPAVRKGSKVKGDFADGKISFEHNSNAYVLSKEWGIDSRSVLSTPDGIVRDNEAIDAILKEILVYGEGVYCDLLFSSQINSTDVLRLLLNSSKNTSSKQDITDALTMAYAQSDGISVDSIEQAIDEKIKNIAGAHWDYEREQPVRKSGRWINGIGEIHKAYYALEDAKNLLNEILSMENEYDMAAIQYQNADELLKEAEKEYESFNVYSSRLLLQSERTDKLKKLEAQMSLYNATLKEWPELEKNLEKAKKLYSEKKDRESLNKYIAVKALLDEINEYKSAEKSLEYPSREEISDLRKTLHAILGLESKMCGMNIAAQIKLNEGNVAEIRSLRTGKKIETSDNKVIFAEAVSVVVPGVMEMQLSPADVDADIVTLELEKCKNKVNGVYEKYNAKNVDELESLLKKSEDIKRNIENLSLKLELELADKKFEDLEYNAVNTEKPRELHEIEKDISLLCSNRDILRFITEKETLIAKNESDYGSVEALKAKAFDTMLEYEKTKVSTRTDDDIPEQYADIKNPEEHIELLKYKIESARNQREELLTKKTAAMSRLQAMKSGIDENIAEAVNKAQIRFDETKELLLNWLHIKEVFIQKKAELTDNPMLDISEKFTYYLNIISSGRVSSELSDKDRLDMNIYSGNNLLDYGKLSEGTKDTVSLAFRLAVLDHLFPDGGGVVVFDDPFSDMDAERSLQSCEIIKDFSKRHQVIFFTCKEEYTKMFGGNIVRI